VGLVGKGTPVEDNLRWRRASVVFAVGLVLALLPLVAAAPAARADTALASPHFQSTWAYTDQPVAAGQASRTWMWGPSPDSPALVEPYWDSSTGWRLVQYFDKTRMEITHPEGDQSSIWYVTNGLLAKELITGTMQLGDNTFEQYPPAQVNVAGDANDPNGPTYATFNGLMGNAPIPSGWVLTQTVDRAGNVGTDPSLSSDNVTAQDVGAPTKHTVASVFWAFMTSTGPVEQNGQAGNGNLFQNPFYATGYPLTEAYWTRVLVGGVQKQVLVQVFERRVLTYTPSNPAGWQVEAGNVGLHYYTWRYQQLQQVTMPMVDLATTPAEVHSCSNGNWTGTDPQVDQFYGKHVTLAYRETQCRVFHGQDGVWWDQTAGTATIFAGDAATGTPIDTRPESDFFYFHDSGNFWGGSARWNRTSTDRLYDNRVVNGVVDHFSNALDGTSAWSWDVFTNPPQTNGGTFPDHPQTCTLDSWSVASDPFGMTFHARLEPNSVPGAPEGSIPYVFNVTGINLDSLDVNQAVTLPAGATLGHFQTGNCLYVYVSPSTPAGQYTVGLNLPDGRHTSVTFQHLSTIGAAPGEGSVTYQSTLTDLGLYKGGLATTSVTTGVQDIRASGFQNDGGWAATASKQTDVGDASVSVDVQFSSADNPSSACLDVRAHFASTSRDYIELCLLGSGQTVVDHVTPYDETLFDRAVRPGTNPVTSWNTLKVVAKGDLFWFYVNDHLIGSADIGANSQGAIGFAVSNNQDAPLDWQFKNLVVKSVQ